jgi:type VI secretion system secreted protein VgrG
MGTCTLLPYALLLLPVCCPPEGRLVSLDKSRNNQDRQAMFSPSNRQDFPHLGSNFEVLAPATNKYNCIGFSLGSRNQWINPSTGPEDNPLLYMDQLYRKHGYVRLRSGNISQEEGKQKLVVYATRRADGHIKAVTHTAVQAADGSWQSKLGELPLIRHLTLSALSGPSYGEPVAVYARNRS